ncbi:hypothetical protein L541_4444, partial [Bordetella hinzii CA90 BAL1384]
MQGRRRGQDEALIGHMHRLRRQVQKDDAQAQPPERLAQRGQWQPRQQHQRQGPARGGLRMALVGQPPGARRPQRAGHAQQAEGADGRGR